MKQNKYDDPEFFAKYGEMPRSTGGLEHAGEWPAFRALLPDLSGKRVLDLGCGFGWHCRYARKAGASSVVGIDLSENMLARARAETSDPAVEYQLGAIEDVELYDGEFDVVLSSLAFHYVADIGPVFHRVFQALSPGGVFVFSAEHPIFTSREAQDWCVAPNGERLHWPVDDYQREGRRRTNWLADDVVKYHRTMAAYVNSLIDAGFQVSELVEPSPSESTIAERPEMADEIRRPMFLLIAASKPVTVVLTSVPEPS